MYLHFRCKTTSHVRIQPMGKLFFFTFSRPPSWPPLPARVYTTRFLVAVFLRILFSNCQTMAEKNNKIKERSKKKERESRTQITRRRKIRTHNDASLQRLFVQRQVAKNIFVSQLPNKDSQSSFSQQPWVRSGFTDPTRSRREDNSVPSDAC